MSEAESSDICGPDGVCCSDDWKANRLLFGGGSAGEAGEEGGGCRWGVRAKLWRRSFGGRRRGGSSGSGSPRLRGV